MVNGFEPYCYIPFEILAHHRADCDYRIRRIDEKPYTAIRGLDDESRAVRKVYCRLPSETQDLKEMYGAMEADVPYPNRFLIDKGIRGGITVPGLECSAEQVQPVSVIHPCRVCFADIECEDERGFPHPERDAITCMTFWDSFTDRYDIFYLKNGIGNDDETTIRRGWAEDASNIVIHQYDHERELLKAMIAYIQEIDPDLLAGWNFTLFDMPYIQGRLTALGLDPRDLGRIPGWVSPRGDMVRGRAVFDLLNGYKRLESSEKPSYRLDAIAEDELGEHKVYHKESLSELWRTDPGKFVMYNWKDVELTVKIDTKKSIIDFHLELSRYVGCPLAMTLNNSQLVDMLVLRMNHERYVLPSRGQNENTGEGFTGATVLDPSVGLKENVIALDLTSLYPTTMMTINASYETKVLPGQTFEPSEVYCAPNGVRFWKSFDGMTRKMMTDLLKERTAKKKERDTHPYDSQEYKLYDLQQRVVKEIMNSYYGVSGFKSYRLYDLEIGAAVTSTGRGLIEFTKQEIEGKKVLTPTETDDPDMTDLADLDLDVIYGDTDSCLVHFPPMPMEDTIRIGYALAKYLNRRYDVYAARLGATEGHHFDIKFEKIYERYLQTGKKKRYAGKLKWKEGVPADTVDITGFESERSDTAAITKEVQKTMLEMIINGMPKGKVIAYIREMLRRYMTSEFPLDEIGIPGGIQKELDQYARPDAHVRGAIYANRYLKTNFGQGSKPKHVYISHVRDTYPQTDVICFEYGGEVPGCFVVDMDVMQKKGFQEPLKRVTDALGWNWNEIDPTRTTLAMFGIV